MQLRARDRLDRLGDRLGLGGDPPGEAVPAEGDDQGVSAAAGAEVPDAAEGDQADVQAPAAAETEPVVPRKAPQASATGKAGAGRGGHAGQVRQRVTGWSAAMQARMSGWSTRKRWAVLVAVPVLVFCCCGTPVVGGAAWLARVTYDAGKGQPSPDAAASAYLGLLSYDQEDKLLPVLDDDRQDELVEQWREYRAAMDATRPRPFSLSWSSLDVGPIAEGRATVRVDVQADWWENDENNRSIMYDSKYLTWIFEARDDDGWRIERVTPAPWCGPGGYVVRCAGDPAPAPTAAASVAPSPSEDPKQRLRDMLPCGPNDPFRDRPKRGVSCPPLTSSASTAPSAGAPASAITPLPSGS